MILNACRIDIVHIQNVMGLSLDMFDVAKELKYLHKLYHENAKRSMFQR